MPRRAMPTWEDRIKQSSEPALRAERDARYRYAAPAIASARGVVRRPPCEGEPPDRAPDAFAGEVAASSPPDDVGQLEGQEGLVVTCFDVLERVANVAPLVEVLESLKHATVLMQRAQRRRRSPSCAACCPTATPWRARPRSADRPSGAENGNAADALHRQLGRAARSRTCARSPSRPRRAARLGAPPAARDLAFYKAADYEELRASASGPAPRELPRRRRRREGRLPRQRPAASGGIGVVVRHARGLAERPRLRRLARARARLGPAALVGLRRPPAPARRLARGGARPALRHRRRDVVGDDVRLFERAAPSATRTSCSRSRTASTSPTTPSAWARR